MVNYRKRLGQQAALTTSPEVEAVPTRLKANPQEEEVTHVPMTEPGKQHALVSIKSMKNMMIGIVRQKRS